MVVKKGRDFPPNCFGELWKDLGLGNDGHLLLDVSDIEAKFRPVVPGEHPDALVIFYLYSGEPMHGAMMLGQPEGMVWQRTAAGAKPGQTCLADVLDYYDPDKENQLWPGRAEFLKLK